MTTALHSTEGQFYGHTDAVVSLTDPRTYFCRECDRWVQQASQADAINRDFGHLTAAPALSDSDENMAQWLARNEIESALRTDRIYHDLDNEPEWVAITDRALALQAHWALTNTAVAQ